ncbi:MAG: Aldehyde Dehydrogenase, partial [Marmoricola sp.]|nr:Aldehyde Dehydrogenase [Marmoricola sp.]
MNQVQSIDPRTGRTVEVVAHETSPDELDALCREAAAAAPHLEDMGRLARAELLRHLADALESRRAEIVPLADRETALGQPRLNGELTRTCFQLRLFADVLEEGSYLEATIDHAADTAMGPRPDLRRMLVPLGPVAVFGASNFPLAFSVPGGDTAAALAAGCPVIVKAHPSHPATSQLCFDTLRAAAAAAGAPTGAIALVHGLEAAAALVAHPAIRAVGFTGSLAGGKALLDIIERRPDPIPFFGELSSLNPVVVTERAAHERAGELAEGIVGSFTLGGGQFCTKPGLVFVPDSTAGDALVARMATAASQLPAQVLLNGAIAAGYSLGLERLQSATNVKALAHGQAGSGSGFEAVPTLWGIAAIDLSPEVTAECFGPLAVVARYSSEEDLLSALDKMPASLTATVLRGAGETDLPGRITLALRDRAGRLVFDAFPTGVAVSWAQHHGGPWPSTNSQHTSVGTTAIRRFLRPVAYQDAPVELLP